MMDYIDQVSCPKCGMEADKWKETTAGHDEIYHVSCSHCNYEKSRTKENNSKTRLDNIKNANKLRYELSARLENTVCRFMEIDREDLETSRERTMFDQINEILDVLKNAGIPYP